MRKIMQEHWCNHLSEALNRAHSQYLIGSQTSGKQ